MPLASCLYALFTGSLATLRHINLQTNAFDLGYVSQAVWYEAHGEPFRFTTVQGVSALLEGVAPATIRHPHWLLAFHVEPALLLLAPLYRLWPDPRLLLWLQAAAIAVGAFPAGWLGARLTGSRVAGLAFAAAWLLAPGLEGAALSDFHMVAFGATLLMAGLCLFEKARPRWALVCLALAALTREDAAATVACVALVLTINCHSERSEESWSDARNWPRTKIPRRLRLLGMRCGTRTPLLLALASALWAALAIGVIEPFFSGGVSVFGARYAWLLHDPLEVPAGDVLAYLALQLLTAGIVGLLAPLQLAAAVPLLAVNALSSFDWMRSGGGHYSALLVPLLLWAAMHGVRRLRCWWGPKALAGGMCLALASAVGAQVWAGASPLHPGFAWPQADPRAAAALAALEAIPGQATTSATSALYPHLSARHDAYWFPAGDGAAWLALDVAGNDHPLSPIAMRDAALRELGRPDAELVSAQAGVLVVRRTSAPRDGLLTDDPAERSLGSVLRTHPELLPPEFYDFVSAAAPATALGPVRFGDSLELIGYELHRWPEVGLLGDSATLVTYWRATQPLAEDLRFALAATRQPDGALAGLQEDASPAPLWWPTSRWPTGRTMRLEMAAPRLRGIQALGVAVEDSAGERLPASSSGVPLWDGGFIAAVARVA